MKADPDLPDDCPLRNIHRDDRMDEIAPHVIECDDPEAHLDGGFTSQEVYDMLRFTGKHGYTKKSERMGALIRQASRELRDYRHLDNTGYGTT